MDIRDRRARRQAEGLGLVQFRVPDTNSAEFKAEAGRQSRLIARSPHEADDQAFIDSLAESWTQLRSVMHPLFPGEGRGPGTEVGLDPGLRRGTIQADRIRS